MQRFRFVRDNDGHDYMIPAELCEKFEAWVDFYADWDNGLEYLGENFDKYRINSPSEYTFTDPVI